MKPNPTHTYHGAGLVSQLLNPIIGLIRLGYCSHFIQICQNPNLMWSIAMASMTMILIHVHKPPLTSNHHRGGFLLYTN